MATTWVQKIQPNLDDNKKKPLYVYQNGKLLTNWVGWCLAVCKASFGATKSMGTALNAWNADKTKHKDYDLPEGVYCLIWWNGGHLSDGTECGHVAIAKRTGSKVKIWSSPYKKSATFTIFEGAIKSTIDGMVKTYGLNKYLGWTEMICEKRVIEAKTVEEKKPEASEPTKNVETNTEPSKAPEPTQNGSSEATEPIEEDSSAPQAPDDQDSRSGTPQPDSENKNNGEQQATKDEFVPATSQDIEAIEGIIQQASEGFSFPKWVKLTAYLVGDAFLVASLIIPDIVNTIQAPTPNIWAEYLSKVLLETGVSVLVVFKLFKKKK